MTSNFLEWMTFRQTVDVESSNYEFIGTYNSESFPKIEETSFRMEIEDALQLIPTNYRNQFSNLEIIKAGKILNNDNKEVIWINNESQNLTFLFEKK